MSQSLGLRIWLLRFARQHMPNWLRPTARRVRAYLRSSSKPIAHPSVPETRASDAAEAAYDAADAAYDPADAAYQGKLAAERATFDSQINVHELPEIFHYWSNKFLRPVLEQYGFSNPDQFFAKYLAEAAQATQSGSARFLSIGSGNCDSEVRIAVLLRQAGRTDFTIECLELSPPMLQRGREDALSQGVAQNLIFTAADFNRWRPSGQYDAVMANQSLHHVLALEHLFDAVKTALAPKGLFITSDMIGRNGHERWPEAKQIVEEFWQELPVSYRYNLQLQRQETQFQDWNCAQDGFEGIRAQDVLPELLKRFHCKLFIAFSNIIDPFIDRSFGHHFDANAAWDRDFVDRLHAYDEAALSQGTLTPTHLMAVMCHEPSVLQSPRNLLPERCVRRPQVR